MNRAILGSFFLSVVAQFASAIEFKANWSGARLVVAGKETRPSRVISPWVFEVAVTKRRFRVLGNSVHEVDKTTGKSCWTATVEEGLQLHWVDATDDVAYLLAYRPPPKTSREPPSSEIRQLDLRTHQWLPPLILPKPTRPVEDGKREVEVVGRLLATKEATFVLVYGTTKSNAPHAHTKADSYQVCCFTPRENKAKWSKEFTWAGAKVGYADSLFTSSIDRSKSQSIQSLRLMQFEILVVCAGATQDLLALDTESGDLRWTIPRIWEFERGFIGPSVFEHYMGRFGIDPFDMHFADSEPAEDATEKERAQAADTRATVAAAKKAFDDEYVGEIVTDPMLSGDRQRLFVAVARGRKRSDASDCIVYQVDDNGEVEAFVHLPNMVRGWPQRTLPEGVLWTCDRGSLVCIGNAEPDFSHGFRGAENCLCPVSWYREYPFRRDAAWLSSDAIPSAATFTDHFLIRTLDGGYIRKNEERVFRFPINVVRLSDGSRQEFLLSVPFAGDVPWPEHGYSKFLDKSCHAHGPYFLYINDFEVEGNRLRVVLKREKGESTALDFDLPDILKR